MATHCQRYEIAVIKNAGTYTLKYILGPLKKEAFVVSNCHLDTDPGGILIIYTVSSS